MLFLKIKTIKSVIEANKYTKGWHGASPRISRVYFKMKQITKQQQQNSSSGACFLQEHKGIILKS